MKAQNAYDLSMQTLDLLDIETELEAVRQRIQVAAGSGFLATTSEPMDLMKVEKLGIELEKDGYFTATQVANLVKDGRYQATLYVNWKNRPANSRERLV